MKMKHLALLIPNTDTTLETDLQRALPKDWVLHTARMQLDEVGEAAERRMVDEALPQALASLRGIIPFDRAVFGCTSASAVYGREGLNRIEAMVGETLDCPAISALGAVLQKMGKAPGTLSVGVLAPYSEEVTGFLVETLRDFGVTVTHAAGLGLSADPEIAACATETILDFAHQQRDALRRKSNLAFFSCTNFRSFEQREQLEAVLGVPVVTSNSSIVDWLLSEGEVPDEAQL